jgi:hypothetical protein
MRTKSTTAFFCMQLIICAVLSFVPKNVFAQCGSLSASVSSNESRCVATGSIVINASGGVAPETYQYLISDGPVTTTYSSISTFSGLPPGTYTIIIKDVTANCTISDSNIIVTGNYAPPSIFYNSSTPTCMNGSNGTIFVTNQSGGRAPFSYQIIAPSPSQVGAISDSGTFTGLIPGLYYIQMTDSCGGIQTRTQLINNYTWSILNTSYVTNNCQDISANVFLTNSNSINSPDTVYSGFQYGISIFPGDTMWFSSSNFNFNIGLYRGATIIAKDNCGNEQSFYWGEPAATAGANVSISNNTCSSFTATVTRQQNLNASATQYCLYDSTDSILVSACQSSPEFDSLSYGTYTVRINDSCYDTTILRTFTASKPSPSVNDNPQFTYTCGYFSAAITGQTDTTNATYCIYTNGNAIPDTCNTTGIFDSLNYGGSYCIQLHTFSACFDTVITRCFTVDKQQPAVNNSVNISNGTCTMFTATITGQANITNPIYRLFNSITNTQIDTDQPSPVFDSLPYGSYCIDIVNDSTCYDTTIVRCFTQLAPDTKISLSAKGSCSLLGATDIKVSFISGVAPFTTMIYSPDGTLLNTVTSFGSSYTFDNLPGLPADSLYKIITTDSCGYQDSATVVSNVYYFNRNITVTPKCPSGTSPNGTSDVTITVTENRGGNFTTTIIKKDSATFNQNADTIVNAGNTYTFTFLSLSSGTYIFDTYSQSCSTHVYDTVTVSDYVYPSLSNSTGYICDNSSQSISSVTIGGLAPFQYQIFGSVPSSPDINTPYQGSPVFNINNGTPYSLIRLRVLDVCGNASINDVGFISVGTPSTYVSNRCLTNPTFLWVDSVANATYLWYKRTYNPIDSIFLDSGSVYNIPSVSLADTGTYIAKTIINAGCETRVSDITLYNDSILCNIVPVKLESFNTIKEDDYSLLNWTVLNELNVQAFNIERSTDNGNTWQQIGEVVVSGNSSSKNEYSFTDKSPKNGVNLYRLQIEDNSGSFTYSSIMQVEMQQQSSMTIFPNPIGKNDELNVQLNGLETGTYKISIVSASAQTINEMTFDVTNTGSVLLAIPSANMASGNYEVIVKGDNQQYSKPVVITNR